MHNFKKIEFTVVRAPEYETTHIIIFDSEKMTREQVNQEMDFFECGGYDSRNRANFLVVNKDQFEFISSIVAAAKEEAYEQGYEAGRNNLLDAGYIPSED